MPPAPQDLPTQLTLDRHWHYDPVPWWVLQYLDKAVVLELARVHLDARKAILAVESKALDETQAILQRGAGLAKK